MQYKSLVNECPALAVVPLSRESPLQELSNVVKGMTSISKEPRETAPRNIRPRVL